jgi:hypothetical protein
MDTGSDDRDVPRTGETAERSGAESDAAAVTGRPQPTPEQLARWAEEPCFLEEELKFLLPPIPDWMRKGPRPKSRQRELFGD